MASHLIRGRILNEVLSLNAQESHFVILLQKSLVILNEVLSLNAQELFFRVLRGECLSPQ